jgi:hypothetical protein
VAEAVAGLTQPSPFTASGSASICSSSAITQRAWVQGPKGATTICMPATPARRQCFPAGRRKQGGAG